MTSCPVLPPNLQAKLAALAWRIRALRFARGLSLTLLTLIVLFAGVFALDLWRELSPFWMRVALTTVGVLTCVAAIRFVTLPLCRPIEAAALAALIERKYPDLGERLMSTIELADSHGPGYGSPVLVALLRQQTAGDTRSLDFLPSYPARSSRALLIAALVALVAALVPAFTWESYADFGRRFWMAWDDRPPFTIEVDSCIAFTAKGRPLTIAARLVPDRSARHLPEQCVLVYAEPGQPARRLPMQPAADHGFIYTISQVREGFEFQIEAAGVLSEIHVVQAIEPVDLAARSPRVTVTPPAYVNRAVHPPQEFHATPDFSALQFSSVRMVLGFTRPAVTARLNVQPREAKQTFSLPLTWWRDRRAASAELPALDPRSYSLSLTMEAEHEITTVRELGMLRIWADEAPRFGEAPRLFSAGEQTASADDILTLQVAVEDQVGVDRADLEYRVNGGPVQREEVFRADGQLHMAKAFRFHLTGKVKDGDVVQLRLRASDNRWVARACQRDFADQAAPATNLTPHVIYEPAPVDGKDRWFTLKIGRPAVTLHEKEVVSPRDELHKRLDEIKKKLARERSMLQQVQPALRRHARLPPEPVGDLAELRLLNREVSRSLQDLADAADKISGLEALSALARDVAGREIASADRALAKAEDPEQQPEPRDLELTRADQHLATAQERLDQLGERIKRLVQDRLDQLHLERIARREEELAKRAAGGPKNDPKAQEELAAIRAEQQRLLDDLRRLAKKSPLFQEALQSRANPATPLAQEAMRLARSQRDLAKQIRNPALDESRKQLAVLAEKQGALAKRVKKLGADLQQMKNEASGVDAAAEQAARALDEGKLAAALADQDASAEGLEMLAQGLAGGKLPADPRKAAEQLLQTQTNLRKRLEKLGTEFFQLKPEEGVRRLQEIEREQKGVGDAAAKLTLPKGNTAAAKERATAVEVAGKAADLLKRRDTLQAFEQMEKAQAALEALRNALPLRRDPPPAPKSGDEKTQHAQAARAKQLAKEQQELRDAAAALAEKLQPGALSAQEAARQEQLTEQARKLAADLHELLKQSSSEKTHRAAKQTIVAAEKAAEMMKRVQSEAQEGHEESAKQAAAGAAKMLDEAGKSALEAGLRIEMEKNAAAPEMAKLAESLQKGETEAGRSIQHLERNQPEQASQAMRQAASALRQGADLAEQRTKPSRLLPGGQTPGQTAGPAVILPPGALPKELETLTGRAWGELPGELRTRLLQDMRARHGEDFARIIQGYFESLASSPSKK